VGDVAEGIRSHERRMDSERGLQRVALWDREVLDPIEHGASNWSSRA
jgi:hypothetical protein